jgi:YgiT-type zinc finger domain-containing protein
MAHTYPTHRCDFCSGTVRPTIASSEPIQVRDGIVLIDGVEIGKCDRCGHTYFPAAVVKAAERVAASPDTASRIAQIPVVNVA